MMQMSVWIKLKQILHTADDEPLKTYQDTNSPGKNFLGVKNPHIEELIGSLDEAVVTEPDVEEARVLGLLRGILDKTGTGASEKTLAAVLNKLPSDPATQTTLAAVLDKLNTGLEVSVNRSLAKSVNAIMGAFSVSTTAISKTIANKDCTIHVLSGDVWINPLTTAVADETAFKLTAGMRLDLRVTESLSLVSDANGATVQIIVWEN